MSVQEKRSAFIKQMAKTGLFIPVLTVFAKGVRSDIVEKFVERRWHLSPSGFTARVVVDWCMENRIEFHVIWRPDLGYEVRPTERGNARLDHAVGSVSELPCTEGAPAGQTAGHAGRVRRPRDRGDQGGPRRVHAHDRGAAGDDSRSGGPGWRITSELGSAPRSPL